MTEKILSFVLVGPPVPKARTRNRSGQHYTPEKTAAAEEAMALLVRSKRVVFPGTVAVRIVYRVARWRGDWDNVAKLVCDALAKGGAVRNDRQIKWCLVEEIVSDVESTSVEVYEFDQRVE